MRILVLSDLWVPFPGGAERLIFNLARELQRAGDDVEVVTGYHPAQQFDGPPFEVLEVPETEEGGDALTEAIGRHDPDVILTHHYWALTFEQQIRRGGKPTVQVVLNGRVIWGAAFAVFISEFVRTRPGMEAEPTDLTVYPPAFPEDVIAPLEPTEAIGFMKPIHHKGVGRLYEIAAAMPERQFVVLRGEWQNIEEISSLPNIEYMEPVDDIRDFYRRVRLVLVPSLSEDAGTVAQECALNRIPCIANDVGGLSETARGAVLMDPATSAGEWVAAILGLDDPAAADAVVQTMIDYGPTSGQREQLDRFVARMHELA